MYISKFGCSSNILGPDTLANPVAALTYIVSSQQPTDCTKPNGNIQIAGLKPNTTYTFSYTKDGGSAINSAVILPDAGGKFVISGLTKGIYDNIKFKTTSNQCTSLSLGPDTLSALTKTTITNSGAACLALGESLSLVAASNPGTTYSWTGPNGFTSNASSINISSVSINDTGNYSVTATVNGCSSYPAITNVRIKTPIAPIATNAGVTCNGQPLNLYASTIPDVTYNWTGPNGFISNSQNPIVPSLTTAFAGTYSVTASKGSCISSAGTTLVTVNPIFSVSMSAINPICAGSSNLVTLKNGPANGVVTYSVQRSGNLNITLDDTGAAYINTGTLNATVTYKLVSISNSTCTYTNNDSLVILVIPDTWTGAIDSNWYNPDNWCGGVPTAETPVSIPSGTPHAPVLPSGISTRNSNLVISNGATMTISANSTFNVSGNLTSNGSIVGAGSVTLGGNTPQTVSGTGTISNLIVNNATGVAIDTTSGQSLNVSGVLTINSGTVNTNNGLVLTSDSTGTGSIGTITGGTISGQVTIQRYVPGGRRCYRFFSHPYISSIALNPELTSKVDITGAGGSTNGFTTTQTNNPSAYWYNPIVGNPTSGSNDPGWTPFTSANAITGVNAWNPFEGVRVLVRGAVGQGLNGGTYTPSATTLQTNGTVNTGRVVVTLQKGTNSSSNLVGNPYPSPVNITPILYAAKQAGTISGNSFYVWDAEAGTVTSPGAYITHSISNLPADDYYLPTNGVFVVNAAVNNGTLTFNETDKVSSAAEQFRTTSSGPSNRIEFRVYSNHDSIYWDRMFESFEPLASNNIDNYDGTKAVNPTVNFYSIAADGTKLSIDARPFVNNMMIPLGFNTSVQSEFKFKIQAMTTPANYVLYLVDNFLNTVQPLQLGTEYTFNVTSDSMSQGNGRFQINATDLNTTAVKNSTANNTTVSDLKVSIKPNPAVDNTIVSFEGAKENTPANISILNVNGQEVYGINVNSGTIGKVNVPLQILPAGIYMVKVTCGTDVITQRLVKQ
ncbi:MAG: T9SS type A sorting domain-containing protein [Bacteroidota bacterium]